MDSFKFDLSHGKDFNELIHSCFFSIQHINASWTADGHMLTNINNIGNEKLSDLTQDEKRYIMSHVMNSIISLAEHLNFNERLPHNHNFYVSALNDKHLVSKSISNHHNLIYT
jgi:hypothetical protein